MSTDIIKNFVYPLNVSKGSVQKRMTRSSAQAWQYFDTTFKYFQNGNVKIKTLEKDMYISYGRTFKTSDKTVVATIPVGYADGYIRKLGENGKVIIKDQFAPIIGRICMDQFMIDVTNIPDVKIGDEVILLGEKNNLKYNADDIAEKLGTINYEVTCMLKSRLPRVYIKNKHIINVKNHI